MGPPAVEIRVEQLHKAFGGHKVLKGVSLEIERGEMVAIVGGSGCGKTVLLQHLIGNLQPDQGRIWLADHEADGAPLVDLATLDERGLYHLKRHWAVVFQRNALFSGTVFENIALWLREIRGMEDDVILPLAREALDSVGFAGDEGVMWKQRDELSGGMAKRVALARALAMKPILMFYDEPTTGLDPSTAFQIHELIAMTHGQRRNGQTPTTTVIITHDKDLLRRLEPRVVMLHEGIVFFDGPFQEFERSSSPVIRPYFEAMRLFQNRVAAA